MAGSCQGTSIDRPTRFRVDLPLSFMGDKEEEGTVLELSKSGCQIKTAVSLQVGYYLALYLSLPGEYHHPIQPPVIN